MEGSFTLVELLIVIAIICVLAALIAPVLKSAKQRAQGALCASNIRQLAMANIMYSYEHRGYLCTPLAYLCTSPANYGTPMYVTNLVKSSILINYGYLGSTNLATNLFRCPADKGDHTHVASIDPPIFTYTRNDEIAKLWPAYGSNTAVNTDTIKYPSRTALLVEEDDTSVLNDAAFGRAVADLVGMRHNGMGNMAFCDGHVEMINGTRYGGMTPTQRVNEYLLPP